MSNTLFAYHLIVNPKAASGRNGGQAEQVRHILLQYGCDAAVHTPESEEASEALVRELTGRGENVHLVSVGGDGTINTVLNGISDFEHTRLSCIPVGSGNDFARNMHLTKDVTRAAVHLMTAPQEILIDYGEMVCRENKDAEPLSRRFIISCGVGYDADICEEVSRHPAKKLLNRLKLGKLVYLAIGIKQMFTRKSTSAVIRLDDGKPVHIRKLFFTVGMLHPCEGGGVPFCPDADPTDGMLDVCMAKYMTPFKSMASLVLVYLGRHRIINKIRLTRCRKLEIKTEAPQWFHIDGDTSKQIQMIEMKAVSGLRFVR